MSLRVCAQPEIEARATKPQRIMPTGECAVVAKIPHHAPVLDGACVCMSLLDADVFLLSVAGQITIQNSRFI
jgi:hypothetical protein